MLLYFAYIYPKKNLMEVACKEVSKVFLSAGHLDTDPRYHHKNPQMPLLQS